MSAIEQSPAVQSVRLSAQTQADFVSVMLGNIAAGEPFTIHNTNEWAIRVRAGYDPKFLITKLWKAGLFDREPVTPGVAAVYRFTEAGFEAANEALAEWDSRHKRNL